MPGWNDLFQEGTTVEQTQVPGSAPMMPGGTDLTQGGAGFAMMGAQPMPEIEAAHVPASGPEDIEKRRNGWLELANRFQNNPNLQRAMMLVGAQMMQPLQPGQNALGATANATIVGMNAYQQGQQADIKEKRALRAEGREDTRLGFEGERLAETKRTGVSQRAATDVGTTLATRTLEDTVASAKASRKKLELAVDKAEKDTALEDLIRDNGAIEALLKRPGIGANVQQEYDLNKAKIEEARAGGRLKAAQAGIAEQEEKLSPAERARLKQTTTTTAEGVKWNLLSQAYDNSPTLRSRHPDKQAWLADTTTSAKTNPAVLFKAVTESLDALPTVKKGQKDPIRDELMQYQQELLLQMRGGGSAPAGSAPPGAPAAGKITKPPEKGYVENGWRYKGGDPSQPSSWEKVQ